MTSVPLLPIRFRQATHPPPILGLLVTLAAVLCWTPLGADTTPPLFTNITSSAGIGLRCDCLGLDFGVGDCGSGVAFTDYDGDGDLDIFVGTGTDVPNRLFENDGFGNFTNSAGAAGVNDTWCTKGVKFADYDNDGDQDFFIAAWDGPNKLYRNNGDATFTDVTAFARLQFTSESSGGAWGDFNNDGNLDLYVAVWDGANLLYRNNGNGKFDEIAAQKGVQNVAGLSFEAVWFDYDNDNDLDIYISNDFGTGNVLYRNNGNETFTDVSVASGAGLSMLAMGIAVADYDHNGFLDLYITNAPVGNALLKNNGDGTFAEVAKTSGVLVKRNGWGTVFFDCDNDGDDDLYVVNQTKGGGEIGSENMLFQNDGGTFTDISSLSGIADQYPGYALAVGDYNNDGYYDIFVQNCRSDGQTPLSPMSFYQNSMSGNNWIKLKTIGVQSNRDGIGARITVTTGSLTQIKEVSGGSSYLSQNSLEVGFGVGTASSIDAMEVRWPSGIIDAYQNVPVNQARTLTEGETVPVFITSFDAVAAAAGVELEWVIVSDEAIGGFRVYRADGGGPAIRLVDDVGLGADARRYVDTSVRTGSRYAYVLAVVMADGTELRSQTVIVELPQEGLILYQNTPNPFNPLTKIAFVLPEATRAQLAVYDAAGRLVSTLVDDAVEGGPHEATWSGRDSAGRPVASGIYFYRLKTGSRTLTRKMILLK